MIDTLTNEITGLRSQVTVLETQSLLINTTLTAQTDHQEYLTARVDSQAGQQANLGKCILCTTVWKIFIVFIDINSSRIKKHQNWFCFFSASKCLVQKIIV